MSVDTLTLAQRLRAAELPAGHAEAIAAAIGAAVLERAATKEDLNAAKADLKADNALIRNDIVALRSETKNEIALVEERLIARIETSKNQILVWVIGALFASVGVIVAAVKL